VYLDGIEEARTPGVIHIPRKREEVILRFEMQGYRSVDVAVDRKFREWSIPQIVLACAIPNYLMLLDRGTDDPWPTVAGISFGISTVVGTYIYLRTGAFYRLAPGEIGIVMEPSE